MAYKSSWKPLFFDLRTKVVFFKNINFYVFRYSIIPEGMEEHKLKVYNGKFNFIINVTKRHANLKFGEFAISRSVYAKGNLKLKKKRKSRNVSVKKKVKK